MKAGNRMHPKLVCKRCGKEIDRTNPLNGKRHHANCMIKMMRELRINGEVKIGKSIRK